MCYGEVLKNVLFDTNWGTKREITMFCYSTLDHVYLPKGCSDVFGRPCLCFLDQDQFTTNWKLSYILAVWEINCFSSCHNE